ncbi:MAG: UDP-4-amino-4,6-dideoxy-N-acetyl-beta-L-altrosamine transaminase [Rhodospirillales bacterium]|nr:UDP-4-amino-4,6-dideoxy-N-acetyl-beta-L-altrosamine transaminase [Rhodospirillales bacterium]
MADQPIPYARQSIDDDDVAAVAQALRGDWLTQGPTVAAFETAVAARLGVKHAVAVATGTAALHCACEAVGIGPGDEIVTTPITFAASGNAGLYLGATVRFADIRPDTYCLDPAKLAAAITPKTKAIVTVDFTGQPCDMDEINRIADARGIPVIVDAAHSLGATYKGRAAGSLGRISALSFHAVKHIALGEGGMTLTDDDGLAARMRLFRTHGITRDAARLGSAGVVEPADAVGAAEPPAWYYEMQELGFNYRITDIQSALGLSQIKKLDRFLARRRAIAAHYDEAFGNSPHIVVPHQETDRTNAWHLYVLKLRLHAMKKSRRQAFDELRAQGIEVNVHYIPLHLQPYYRQAFGYKRGDFPVAEAFYAGALTIPLFPGMSDADVERVIATVQKTVR